MSIYFWEYHKITVTRETVKLAYDNDTRQYFSSFFVLSLYYDLIQT